jgi:APA family basic amino acid/polyamine antiporter
MTDVSADAPDPLPVRRQLGLIDAASIIVGVIVGVGFLQSSPAVAAAAGSAEATFAVWALGGFTALLGAACYAELAAMLPRDGGEYVFLTRAFGPRVGFLFAWTAMLVVRPGNIGALALVFAANARQLTPLPWLGTGTGAQLAWAAGAVVAFTGINAVGLRGGKGAQNLLTAAKLLGLAGLFAVAVFAPAVAAPGTTATAAASPSALPVSSAPAANWGLAMVLVLFAYGGWEDVTYVSAEVRDPRQNLRRALLLGTAAVTLLYLLGTAAFVRSLGYAGLAGSDAVAADVLRRPLGDGAARAISLLVSVCALGAMNGMILTGSRITYAAAADHPALGRLGRFDGRRGVPMRSLLLQSAVTLGSLVAFGRDPDGFERMVTFTAPTFWAFYLLVGVGLIVIRRREPNLPRPYRVPLYPLTPVLFCLTGAFMLQAGLAYAWEHRAAEAFWTIGVLTSGAGLMWLVPRRPGPAGEGDDTNGLGREDGDGAAVAGHGPPASARPATSDDAGVDRTPGTRP